MKKLNGILRWWGNPVSKCSMKRFCAAATDGIIYIEDEKGSLKQVLFEDEKTDGQNIELSIDSKTQERAYTLMASNLVDGQSGAVIVMDYSTGTVEAMVSYPSFDNNLFNFPLDEATWNYYNGDEDHPLINREIQSAYMPGSSFKPFSPPARHRRRPARRAFRSADHQETAAFRGE